MDSDTEEFLNDEQFNCDCFDTLIKLKEYSQKNNVDLCKNLNVQTIINLIKHINNNKYDKQIVRTIPK